MLFISFRNHTVRNWNVKNWSNPSLKPYSNKQKTINANTTIIQYIHSVMKYLCLKWSRICSTCRKHFPDHSSFITATYPSEAPSHTPVFSGVRVTRSLVLWVCFVDCCLILLSVFRWPLCWLFFDLRILITPLVSSISSSVRQI